MRNCSLETQTTKIKAVIDYPFRSSIDQVVNELNKDGHLFALIIHDKDVNDDGVVKISHIHLVIRSPKRHQIKYYITYLAAIFDKVKLVDGHYVDTNDGVQVMLSESFEWDLQYLIHKNDQKKYQYSVTDIIHNLKNEQFNEMLNVDVKNVVSCESVLDIIRHSVSEFDVALKLGIGNYNLYSKFISMCIKKGQLGKDL